MRRKNNTKHVKGGRRKNKSGVVRKAYIGQNRVTRELGVIDTQTQPYVYRELPSLQFATAAQTGAIYYYSNNMAQFLVGTPAAVPYWEVISGMYERYLVMSSSVFVEVQNRETVNSITVCVFPATVNSVINTPALFTTVQSLPGAKTFTLQAASGGMSTHTFRLSLGLPRMVGEQYEEQDQWGGVAAAGNPCTNVLPTSSIYWGIAFYNATGNNTLTTGGITCQVSVRNVVRLNKPIRGPLSDLFSHKLSIPVIASIPNRPPTFEDKVAAISAWLSDNASTDVDSLSAKLTTLCSLRR